MLLLQMVHLLEFRMQERKLDRGGRYDLMWGNDTMSKMFFYAGIFKSHLDIYIGGDLAYVFHHICALTAYWYPVTLIPGNMLCLSIKTPYAILQYQVYKLCLGAKTTFCNIVGFPSVRISSFYTTISPWILIFYENYVVWVITRDKYWLSWCFSLSSSTEKQTSTFFHCAAQAYCTHWMGLWPNNIKLLGRLKRFLATDGLKLQRWYQEGNQLFLQSMVSPVL